MAGRLLADGATSFHRVLTDPRDGAPLEIGRTSYRIPTAMRQWLRMRDGKCPFPGCSNHSLDNDADHLHAWAHGGTTGISNLAQPCPKHHRLKHNTGWTPSGAGIHRPPGWISPTGRHYPSEEPDREPPHWPDHAFHNDKVRHEDDLFRHHEVLPMDPDPPDDHPHPAPCHEPDPELGLDPGWELDLDRALPQDPLPGLGGIPSRLRLPRPGTGIGRKCLPGSTPALERNGRTEAPAGETCRLVARWGAQPCLP
jgi:hypothetical protein